MKQHKTNNWASLLEDEIRKDKERPDNALSHAEIMRMTGFSHTRVSTLLAKLISNKKAKQITGRTTDSMGRSIQTLLYVIQD